MSLGADLRAGCEAARSDASRLSVCEPAGRHTDPDEWLVQAVGGITVGELLAKLIVLVGYAACAGTSAVTVQRCNRGVDNPINSNGNQG